jgi:hypothetical protein
MATESVGKRAAHRRGLKVTALACLGGVVAGLVSSSVATGATDSLGLAIGVAAVFASMGAMRVVGIDVSEFSTKDHLYVAFMTLSLWFVVWTILLTTGTSL